MARQEQSRGPRRASFGAPLRAARKGGGRALRVLLPVTLASILAGAVYAVSGIAEPSAVLIVLVPITFGALILGAFPASAQRAIAAPLPTSRGSTQSDLVDLLLKGNASGAGWVWQADEQLRLRGDLARFATVSGGRARVGVALSSLLAEATPGAMAIGRAIACGEPFHDVVAEARLPGTGSAWWRLSGKPVLDEQGRFAGYHGLGSDISALREAQARIAHLATHDALTGLANRESFQEEAARACSAAGEGAAPHALLVLDLDGFKQVNDDFGHAVGDELLTAVAHELTRVVPDGAMVARLGGDEFAVLYAPVATWRPETLAQAIIRVVSAPFTLGQHQARIGVSIGIALAPEHAVAPRSLARKADLALYRAKDKGGGRYVVFVEAFEREREEQLRLEADIASALERDEFVLHYQPLLDLAEARVGTLEALIRWTSPTRGTVAPADFIPSAESNGSIVAIGRFVLARACRDAVAWTSPASVAVNISPQHLRSPGFKTDVLDALAGSGMPPSRLEIEITEGVFLDRSRASIEAMTWLRERGIKVALDDFGTGFSSLNYLVEFPVDKIKIDRSFIAGLVDSHQSRAIVDAILTLARTLGIRVVAEGVETTEQALALKLRRCDDLQGYLIARPQPAQAIGRLLHGLPADLRSRVPALLESSLAAALVMKRSA